MITQKIGVSFTISLIFLILAGCSNIVSLPTPTPDSSLYVLDPVFREFYNMLGGKDVLGEVISEMREIDGVKQQYTVGGLLIFDANAPETSLFQFGPLGREFGIIESPEATLGIADPFKEIYKRLGGSTFIGKPLTGLIFNAGMNRYEQYFEKLGFYMGPETGGVVRLLPYGVWKCGDDCRKPALQNGIPELPKPTVSFSKLPPELGTPTKLPTPTPIPVIEATQKPPAELPVAPSEWSMMIWEKNAKVSSKQSQRIGVEVFKDNLPAEGAKLDLIVLMPDDTTQKFSFEPTNATGFTYLRLPPILAENGTIIFFRVCVTTPSVNRYCLIDSFQIWGNN